MILSEDILALSKMFAEGSEPSSHIHETNMPMLILYAQHIYCIFVAWILYTVAQLFKPKGMINWEILRLSLSLFVFENYSLQRYMKWDIFHAIRFNYKMKTNDIR